MYGKIYFRLTNFRVPNSKERFLCVKWIVSISYPSPLWSWTLRCWALFLPVYKCLTNTSQCNWDSKTTATCTGSTMQSTEWWRVFSGPLTGAPNSFTVCASRSLRDSLLPCWPSLDSWWPWFSNIHMFTCVKKCRLFKVVYWERH